MPDENTPQDFPDIGPPTLKQDTEDTQTSGKNDLTDEQKRLKAIQITTSRRDYLFEKQKEISNELRRSNEDLQNANDKLISIQQTLSAIQQKISSHLNDLNKIQEDIREVHRILEVLTSSDLAQGKQIVQKVIDSYETNIATNINNSVIKVFDYSKYN